MRFKPYLRLDELAYSVPNDYRFYLPAVLMIVNYD